ncbi:DUF1349 domain-containing protein [Mesorhizobium argentiipisi]|uniref:DUF1349 domain-containing protein n=1 Tax=Mesorhizobium argentiipisi TaxID=3015175 RepID=A0ABU8K9X6_9HYPH
MSMNELSWLNEPPHHTLKDGTLEVTTGEKTDFWRETFYDFWRDDGHFLFKSVAGDFTAEVTVQGDYEVLYDQAGLMMRLSESHWIKAGLEFTDGKSYFSVVVTNDASDWSLVEVPVDPEGIRIRLTRHDEAIRVQYFSVKENTWIPVRLAYFPTTSRVDVGVMCCSPQRSGFKARFKDLNIGPPINRELHD